MKNYQITYRKFTFSEQQFVQCINDIVIHYPIMWATFKNSFINHDDYISIEKNILIFNILMMNKIESDSFFFVLNRIIKTPIVKKYVKTIEFIFIYPDTGLLIEFFQSKILWLKFITTLTLREITNNLAFTNTLIVCNDSKLIVDSFMELKGTLYFFFLVDSLQIFSYQYIMSFIEQMNDKVIVNIINNSNSFNEIETQIKYNINHFQFKNIMTTIFNDEIINDF